MGTDTEFGRPDFWQGGPNQAPVGWSQPAVVPRDGDRHDVRYADQERLTSNVQLSTFKGGDRKGAWWVGYGDRHDARATGLLTRRV